MINIKLNLKTISLNNNYNNLLIKLKNLVIKINLS